MVRGFLAVLAGFVTIFLLVGLADAIYMHVDQTAFTRAGAPIGAVVVLVTTAYLECINVIGGYVTARIARDTTLRYATVLAALGLAITLVVAVTQRNAAPRTYLIATTLLVFPMCLLGGALGRRRLQQAGQGTR